MLLVSPSTGTAEKRKHVLLSLNSFALSSEFALPVSFSEKLPPLFTAEPTRSPVSASYISTLYCPVSPQIPILNLRLSGSFLLSADFAIIFSL